jgi:hypothetical protein
MEELKEFLFAWNDWIVLPILTLVSLVLYFRCPKVSTLWLSLGMTVLLASSILKAVYPHPQSFGYLIGMVFGIFGLVASIFGAIWFFRKDYSKKAKLNPSFKRDA